MKNDHNINNLNNPHDKLFRTVWSNTENAAGFLQHYLPDNVLKVLDISSLEIVKDSFIEKDLQDYYSDMLYKVMLAGSPGYIYVLFEHKSYFDKNIHMQLLEYMTKIWRQSIKNEKKREKQTFPIIIPIVLCHGKQTWSKDSAWFSSQISGPVQELSDYIPDFKLDLHDLNHLTDDQIKGTIMARVVMLLFKYASDPDLLKKLPDILSLMNSLIKKNTGLEYLETVLRYLFGIMDNISAQTIKNIAEKAISDNKGGELVMTLAEQLYKEGEIKGIAIGEIKGMAIGEEKGMAIGEIRGLRDAIELGMALKFPEDLNTVMNGVKKINNISILKTVKDAIKIAKKSSEIIILLETLAASALLD